VISNEILKHLFIKCLNRGITFDCHVGINDDYHCLEIKSGVSFMDIFLDSTDIEFKEYENNNKIISISDPELFKKIDENLETFWNKT